MATERPDPGEREGAVMTSAGPRPSGRRPAGHGNRGLLCNGSVEGVLVGWWTPRMLDGATRDVSPGASGSQEDRNEKRTKEDAREELKGDAEIVVARRQHAAHGVARQIGLWTLRIRRPKPQLAPDRGPDRAMAMPAICLASGARALPHQIFAGASG